MLEPDIEVVANKPKEGLYVKFVLLYILCIPVVFTKARYTV